MFIWMIPVHGRTKSTIEIQLKEVPDPLCNDIQGRWIFINRTVRIPGAFKLMVAQSFPKPRTDSATPREHDGHVRSLSTMLSSF
jgi:hypothetical protein